MEFKEITPFAYHAPQSMLDDLNTSGKNALA